MTTTQCSPRRGLTLLRTFFVSLLTLLTVLIVPAGIASAHTSFDESSPANGDTIPEPVSTITIQFSGESEYGDDGFTVLTPDGVMRSPTTVSSSDQKVFELTFDPPLAGGQVGVRWAVNAPDAHPIDGAFSFTVTAPATASGLPTDASAASPAAVDPLTTTAGEGATDSMVMADGSVMDMSSAATSLDDFMAVQPDRNGDSTARWGRLIEFAALALLIGGAAFAATTLRGRRDEIDRAITVLRVLGVTLAIGALLEYVGATQIAQASIAGYWTSQPGMATLLRIAGGLAIAAGLATVTVPVRTPAPTHSLSAAVNSTLEYERQERVRAWPDDNDDRSSRPTDRHRVDRAAPLQTGQAVAIDPLLHRHQQRSTPATGGERHSITISTSPPPRPSRPVEDRRAIATQRTDERHDEAPVIRQWVLGRSSTVACIGVTVAVMSFWLDGHTVSKGPRPLHAIVNSVHVVAGSIWLGGVVAMAVVLWTRHRTEVAPRALEMILRFSGIATVALGAVLAAGGVMAFLILDSVGELFSTEWGQVLLLKSTAAGLAMLGGAYNHFRLLPALEANPDDPRLVGHLRSAVTSEAILLGFVIVVTASLVAAAS